MGLGSLDYACGSYSINYLESQLESNCRPPIPSVMDPTLNII